MDVKGRIENAELISWKEDSSQSKRLVNDFIRDAKRDLTQALQNDRLSLLSRPLQGCITREMISPRYIIPSDYLLELRKVQDCGYSIHLYKRNEAGIFNPISLDRTDDDNVVDCLVNLKASLCCAAVAIDGERYIYQTRYTHMENKDKVDTVQLSIKFIQVNAQGNLMRTENSQFGKCKILGINQNQRIVQLSQFIENSDDSLLVTTPIKHLIGAGIPVPILKKLSSPYPESFTTLNEEQQLVAHPLRIKTALEVAGPPGTGKTKTITELTRSLLDCSSYDILVLSERNGAIDAIGEKYSRCCWKEGSEKSISDFELWKRVLTFGSNGIGEYTKLFTLPEKVRHHPDLRALNDSLEQAKQISNRLQNSQVQYITEGLFSLGRKMGNEDYFRQAEYFSKKYKAELKSPLQIIEKFLIYGDLLTYHLQRKNEYLTEEVIHTFIGKTSLISQEILHKWTTEGRSAHPGTWKISENLSRLKRDLRALNTLLSEVRLHPVFNSRKASEVEDTILTLEDEIQLCTDRVIEELRKSCRLKMCTIGSLHHLQSGDEKRNDTIDFRSISMNRLSIKDDESSIDYDWSYDDESEDVIVEGERETVVIFDESGCIPSYELLSLSQLSQKIVSIIVVGDVHQLPPYDPGCGLKNKKSAFGSKSSRVSTIRVDRNDEKLRSILDVSRPQNGKIELVKQYRVPRDVAALLSRSVYHGKYMTPKNTPVPENGFQFIHVDPCIRSPKYVNHNEIDKLVSLLQRSDSLGKKDIIVLTPYKKQQRAIQSKLLFSLSLKNIPVMTIDQCQGQEADIVFISLVSKPTKFLNKNRLNVAISRMREKLYLLADEVGFRKACEDLTWDASLLAKRILIL